MSDVSRVESARRETPFGFCADGKYASTGSVLRLLRGWISSGNVTPSCTPLRTLPRRRGVAVELAIDSTSLCGCECKMGGSGIIDTLFLVLFLGPTDTDVGSGRVVLGLEAGG